MADEPETTQDQPTQPRPETDDGVQLDQWGLPLSGPLRVAALAELGKPDPLTDPDAWAAPAAKPLQKMTKAELRDTAAAEGVEVTDTATNAELIAAIEAKRKPATNGAGSEPAGEN